MAEAKIYNLEGEELGVLPLPDAIYNVEAKPELIYQAVRVLRGRSRQALAHTKTRSEVRGGGKKPWAQKGTGRARHGSIRSPIWRGGGITFGPRNERVFSLDLPKKMSAKALRAALSAKVKAGKFIIVSELALAKPATKTMANFFKKMELKDKRVMLLVDGNGANAARSVRNLPLAEAVRLENINLLNVLAAGTVVISQEAVKAFNKQLGA